MTALRKPPFKPNPFQDVTVVLVSLAGHPRGSIGMFVQLKTRRFFVRRGHRLERPRHFDARGAASPRQTAGRRESGSGAGPDRRLHRLQARYPQLTIVPVHDGDAQKSLPNFPRFLRERRDRDRPSKNSKPDILRFYPRSKTMNHRSRAATVRARSRNDA